MSNYLKTKRQVAKRSIHDFLLNFHEAKVLKTTNATLGEESITGGNATVLVRVQC